MLRPSYSTATVFAVLRATLILGIAVFWTVPAWGQARLAFPSQAATPMGQPRIYRFGVGPQNIPRRAPANGKGNSRVEPLKLHSPNHAAKQVRPAQWRHASRRMVLQSPQEPPLIEQFGGPPGAYHEEIPAPPGEYLPGEYLPSFSPGPGPWTHFSFLHTTCTCPQHWRDPWCCYCAERLRRHHGNGFPQRNPPIRQHCGRPCGACNCTPPCNCMPPCSCTPACGRPVPLEPVCGRGHSEAHFETGPPPQFDEAVPVPPSPPRNDLPEAIDEEEDER
jgi:hypothetical protein